MLAQLPVLDAHRLRLRQAFAERLLGEKPTTVLDLGAGSGELVAALAARDVDARGIEPDPAKVAAAKARGVALSQGRADKLSEGPGEVEWVTFRHVLHHLHSPERALKEAARVAGTGIAIAEPFSTTGLPEHRATIQLEEFTRFFDRRRGRVHGDDLNAADVVSLLPGDWKIEVSMYCPLTLIPEVETQRMLARAIDGFELDSFQKARLQDINATARTFKLAAPGTLMVIARRPEGDR